MQGVFDLVIVGGGINGAGIAADAAGRGLSVLLAEKSDLASGTSSASSKLIHGGLRYLEHYDFRLVRHALLEREAILAKAPHIVWPLRFLLPVTGRGRPRWMLRAGLFLYDHLAPRHRIPASCAIDFSADPAAAALKPEIRSGFAYWDCWVDDARLVVLNARAAADRGAEILTRSTVTSIRSDGALWIVMIEDGAGRREVAARAIVNAAGPWVDGVSKIVHANASGVDAAAIRLVKGSHVVVPRIPSLDDAVLLQAPDGRVVFLLPFEERFTLVGTTDVPFSGDPASATISDPEVDYLLDVANGFLRRPLTRAHVVWSYAGVRPLYDDRASEPSAVTRDYRFELSAWPAHPPLLTVLGGKVTTYRRLAEDALAVLGPHFPAMKPAWTATAPLPGGDIAGGDIEAFLAATCRRHPGFDPAFLRRLARRHGTALHGIIADCGDVGAMGGDLGGGLTPAEVRWLATREWARTPDDVLWRRTKCGLHMSAGESAAAADRIAALL